MSSQFQTAKDIPLQITSSQTRGERRISPSWTISQLKTKLEPVTGIPPSSQHLILKTPGRGNVQITASDEDAVQISTFGLGVGSEIEVQDTRPAGQQQNFSLTDPSNSNVQKYTMPEETYAGLQDSVLAWKKSHKLGRFDPNAPEIEAGKAAATWYDIESRQIAVGKRCQLGEDSSRRGVVKFVGEIAELPGVKGGAWIGIELDEPVGKNDGHVGERDGRRRVFECHDKRGVFVRPERVTAGDFPVLDELGIDEDMEEI